MKSNIDRWKLYSRSGACFALLFASLILFDSFLPFETNMIIQLSFYLNMACFANIYVSYNIMYRNAREVMNNGKEEKIRDNEGDH